MQPWCTHLPPDHLSHGMSSSSNKRITRALLLSATAALSANQVMMHVIPGERCWSEAGRWEQSGRRESKKKGHLLPGRSPRNVPRRQDTRMFHGLWSECLHWRQEMDFYTLINTLNKCRLSPINQLRASPSLRRWRSLDKQKHAGQDN